MKVRIPRSLVVQILVGTPEEIRSGRGAPVVTAKQARQWLGLSEAGFRLLVTQGYLAPVGQVGKALLFLETDVERLRREREA